MSPRYLISVFALFFTFIAIAVAQTEWTPVQSISDARITKLANFAVSTHNSQSHSNLVFQKVVKGDYKIPVRETYYRLDIQVQDGSVYQAVIVEKFWVGQTNLVSFVKI